MELEDLTKHYPQAGPFTLDDGFTVNLYSTPQGIHVHCAEDNSTRAIIGENKATREFWQQTRESFSQ